MNLNQLHFKEENFDIIEYMNGQNSSDDLNNVLLPEDLMRSSLNPVAVDPSGPPLKGDDPGIYNFEVALDIAKTDKKKYVYSRMLNRVYLMMGVEMAVQFTWDWKMTDGSSLWVRATPVFSAGEHQEMRVARCLIHNLEKDPSNKGLPLQAISHVMHSVRNDAGIQYCGLPDNENQWLSVAVLLPSEMPGGVRAHQHVYRFGCNHSCTSGINRRKMEVLFTLENSHGDILGRKSLGVRVCSCPRRDMDKDEKEYKMHNPSENFEEPPRKKRLLQKPPQETQHNVNNNARNVLAFHNYQLPDIDSYDNVLNTAYNINMMVMRALPPGDVATNVLQRTITELKSIINSRAEQQL